MKIKHLLCILFLAGTSFIKAYAQQNIQFTQYIFNSLSVNPAYAGYKEEWFAQLGLRTQLVGIEGAPKTGQLSIDGLLDPDAKRHGIGFQLTADNLGAQSATSAYADYGAVGGRLSDEPWHRKRPDGGPRIRRTAVAEPLFRWRGLFDCRTPGQPENGSESIGVLDCYL